MQPTLYGERVNLRAFRTADADRIVELLQNPEIADNTLNIPYPYERWMALDWLDTHALNFENGISVNYAITLRGSGELCGSIGLVINEYHQHAEMGYWLGKAYWNSGLMTEAARLVIDYGFRDLGLHRIHANHFPRNPASGRVMQKAGMQYEGLRREYYRKDDHFEDVVLYFILKQDWQPRH
ncbi:MAG: GNAT family N-acetyltransferase [Anaerolineae bacterium]|nr:GNAT family N-acetyltransferase [Anaerolineae bacterium]